MQTNQLLSFCFYTRKEVLKMRYLYVWVFSCCTVWCCGHVVHQTVSELSFCQSDSPCLNGGTCRGIRSNYWCQCPEEYGGRHCERGRLNVIFFYSNHCKSASFCGYKILRYNDLGMWYFCAYRASYLKHFLTWINNYLMIRSK